MSILTLENVSRDFDGTILFSNVTFGLEPNERVALIGANGTGKTTLLRMIVGEETPDSGRVYRTGNPVVGYLSQNPPFDPGLSVLDTIFNSSDQTMRLLHDYEEVCQKLETVQDGEQQERLLSRMNDLTAQMNAVDAWSLETDAKIILDRLGITDVTAPMGSLSGGQRKRVAMAHALIERPDLLVLDEPTNHLDAETITWLEEFLVRYSGALLLVTHDRYFLERVTQRIVEIDRKTVRTYAGNYSYYLQKKEEEEERREVEEHKREMLRRQELAWLRSGAKARRTKQKARTERAVELLNTPREEKKEKIDLALAGRRLGSRVIEMEHVSKAYGEKRLIDDFTHIMQPGERVGVIGRNGTGKTTLLEMIVGNVEPDRGKIEIGETVILGYYDQESRALDDDLRVIDYIKAGAEQITTSDGGQVTASQMLERFLFAPSAQYALVGNLSGGERRRLFLLRLLMTGPNVLILDEPTNDLDIATLQALENYLDDFPGAVIVVSHDRYFLDRTVDHLFRFEGEGKIREYPGDYSAFLEINEREEEERRREEGSANQGKRKEEPRVNREPTTEGTTDAAAPRKLSYKEQKELATLEKKIEESEARKRELEERLATVDYQAARELAEELRGIEEEIEGYMERWMELG